VKFIHFALFPPFSTLPPIGHPPRCLPFDASLFFFYFPPLYSYDGPTLYCSRKSDLDRFFFGLAQLGFCDCGLCFPIRYFPVDPLPFQTPPPGRFFLVPISCKVPFTMQYVCYQPLPPRQLPYHPLFTVPLPRILSILPPRPDSVAPLWSSSLLSPIPGRHHFLSLFPVPFSRTFLPPVSVDCLSTCNSTGPPLPTVLLDCSVLEGHLLLSYASFSPPDSHFYPHRNSFLLLSLFFCCLIILTPLLLAHILHSPFTDVCLPFLMFSLSHDVTVFLLLLAPFKEFPVVSFPFVSSLYPLLWIFAFLPFFPHGPCDFCSFLLSLLRHLYLFSVVSLVEGWRTTFTSCPPSGPFPPSGYIPRLHFVSFPQPLPIRGYLLFSFATIPQALPFFSVPVKWVPPWCILFRFSFPTARIGSSFPDFYVPPVRTCFF